MNEFQVYTARARNGHTGQELDISIFDTYAEDAQIHIANHCFNELGWRSIHVSPATTADACSLGLAA